MDDTPDKLRRNVVVPAILATEQQHGRQTEQANHTQIAFGAPRKVS
jgi:hypothetical protein